MNLRDSPKAHRGASKPQMERQRRARINGCLGELRALLLQSHTAKSCRRSKLEKADILELTVRHLKALTQGSGTADGTSMSRFYEGYAHCVKDVSLFLSASDGIHYTARATLLHRLSDRAASLKHNAETSHYPQLPYRFPFVCGLAFLPDTYAPVQDSHLLRSVMMPDDGQPLRFPAMDSAFQSTQQRRNPPAPKPGETLRVVSETCGYPEVVIPVTTLVWRPW